MSRDSGKFYAGIRSRWTAPPGAILTAALALVALVLVCAVGR